MAKNPIERPVNPDSSPAVNAQININNIDIIASPFPYKQNLKTSSFDSLMRLNLDKSNDGK